MNELIKNHYKEKEPKETVEYIKRILKNLNIDVEEEWVKGNTDTSSLRLYVKGTKLGSNGKGINEDYARASAYSEFMERYQNMWISKCHMLWDNEYDFNFYIDETYKSAEELINENNSFIQFYFRKRNLDKAPNEVKIELFKKYQKMDFNITEKKNQYLCLPFYNISNEKVEYLPYYAYSKYYLSNGMCAGNSKYEALVQGFSEIIERYVQKRIIKEKIALPDIPESYLSKFPEINNIYKKLKVNNKYTVIFKDCSLGGVYPVAALILIEKNTGRYGVKLGCHPNYGLAMERAITEAAQGNNIYDYVNRSRIDFYNQHVFDDVNILNGFKTGFSQYPFEIFSSKPDFEFTPIEIDEKENNHDIFKRYCNKFKDLGYQVLIRDVSYLGFPSYHIIIPDFSEVKDVTDTDLNATNTKFHISKLINNPKNINESNVNYIISTMKYFANSQLDNTMESYYNILGNDEFKAEEYGLGWLYYISMCYFINKNYIEAAKNMEFLNNAVKEITGEDKYKIYLHYLQAMSKLNDHNKCIEYLRVFYTEDKINDICSIFSNPYEVISKQYPTYNLDLIKSNSFNYNSSKYNEFKRLTEIFKLEQRKRNLVNLTSNLISNNI